MFEGSLVESRGLIVSGTKRWTAFGSAVFQFGVAGLLIAIPLLHPGILPIPMDPAALVAPVIKPPRVQIKIAATTSSSTAMSMPASAAPVTNVRGVLSHPAGADPGPEPVFTAGIHMGDGMPGTTLLGAGESGPSSNVSVAAAKKIGPVNVSSGVLSGMLLGPIQPVYPAIAKATRTEGTVVIEAVISKTGCIESLHVVSGPPMLRSAAMDAVQAARYRPYRLNGEATEVQTTITVNFRLGS
jgi:protein TonB